MEARDPKDTLHTPVLSDTVPIDSLRAEGPLASKLERDQGGVEVEVKIVCFPKSQRAFWTCLGSRGQT